MGATPQSPNATADSSVGCAVGWSSAKHKLSRQCTGKICCEGEAEGEADTLEEAVALTVEAALVVGRDEDEAAALADEVAVGLCEAVYKEVVLADGRAEGEGAEEGDAATEGEGEREAAAEAVGEADGLAVAVGECGGPHTPAAFSTLPALQVAPWTVN